MSQRVALGEALRALRKERGLTEVELAEGVGVTQTSIWRYEAGKRLPPAELLETIADVLGAPKRVKRELLDQLHGAQNELESNREVARRGLGRRQEEVARVEARATQIRSFQAAVVPGLLQTSDYARTIFNGAEKLGLDAHAKDVARALAARLERQAILHDSSKRFGFVITEAVLLWPREDPGEMLAQLDRIQAVSDLRNVDLAILPLGFPPPLTPLNSFTIYDEAVVHVETLTTQLAIRDPADIAVYVKAYEAFRNAALSGPEARKLLKSVTARFGQL